MKRHTLFPARSAAEATDSATSDTRGIHLELSGVGRAFGTTQVLDGIDLDITPGQFVAVVGRSGCGKSTLLRLIAGLDAPSQGAIRADGQPLATQRDQTRLMFQNARLLPWKRVIDNVGIGLSGKWRDKARAALDEVGLADKADAWPAQLSGGQQQRVALARALIHEPQLLLLDEPLGALDALTRLEMQALIERLWQEHGFTVLLVTHDVPEAVQLADRVIVLEAGGVGMDLAIDVARPREHNAPQLNTLEGQVLDRVLGRESPAPVTADAAAPVDETPPAETAEPRHARVQPIPIHRAVPVHNTRSERLKERA